MLTLTAGRRVKKIGWPASTTPGSEHLSALREPYLRLLASERGLSFIRPESPEALIAALTGSGLAKESFLHARGCSARPRARAG